MKRLVSVVFTVILAIQLFAAHPVAKYTIVYSSTAEPEEGIDMARALQAAVLASTGEYLNIVSDQEARPGYQIVISRGEVSDTFDYSVSVSGRRVNLNGGGCWAMTKAVRLIQENLAAGKALERIRVSGNIYAEQLFPRTAGSDLRILDDNIWQYDKENVIPDIWQKLGVDCRNSVRYKALAEVILAYNPDIVTLQEYSSKMDAYLAPELAKYGFVNCVSHEGEHWNFTPIFYNKETVKPVESKYVLYTPEMYSNQGTKSLTAGVFTLLSSGKNFAVVNTHLWWQSETQFKGSELARASQLRLCMAIAENLLDKHGDMPLFAIGDLNTTSNSIGLRQMYEYGYVPVQNVASVYGDRSHGHHVCGPKDGFSRETHRKGDAGDFYGAIDHFMIYSHNRQGNTFSGAEVKVFERITPYFTIEFTDHYPNYADIKL